MTFDKKTKAFVIALVALLLAASLLAAQPHFRRSNADAMQNGFYTAEVRDFDEKGWKEYVTIYVLNNAIVTVDYNAKNASGFVKSWDMEYMRRMNESEGTYPNKYTREYAEALLNRQDPARVDAVSGATRSHASFQRLVKAAMEQARLGNPNVIYVDSATNSGR